MSRYWRQVFVVFPFIASGDPRVGHAANCPICMRRLLALRREHHSLPLRLVLTAAVASCLLIAALLVGLTRRGPNSNQQTADPAAVPESVDLWNAGTFRGDQPGSLRAVTLPAALVKVTIFLPRYSDPGGNPACRDLPSTGPSFSLGAEAINCIFKLTVAASPT
jgi:hypothetical protein